LEAVFCKKPVVQYTDPKIKINIGEKEIKSPFIPYSNDPKSIAEIIDRVVESGEFRNKLFDSEYKFAKEVSNPQSVAEWWDNLFEELVKKHKSIKKNSSNIKIKFRILYFLTANRLYWKKIKNKITTFN